jgi:glucose dehydrogenase
MMGNYPIPSETAIMQPNKLIETKPIVADPRIKWQGTGVIIELPPGGGQGNTYEIIDTQQNQWTANPVRGFYFGDGDPHPIVSGPGNPLPGENEGLLVGKLGFEGHPFAIGLRHVINSTFLLEPGGELFLIINDELNPKPGTGQGFADNEGSLNVLINTYAP